MFYLCSGARLLGDAIMQGAHRWPKCLRLRTPQQSGSAPTGSRLQAPAHLRSIARRSLFPKLPSALGGRNSRARS